MVWLAAWLLTLFVPLASARPVLVHPLGDSITRGFDGEGYRRALSDRLVEGKFEFHFVGSLETGPSGWRERAHDGHNGAVIEDLTRQIEGWLERFRPDVILLMIGANDIEAGASVDTVIARLRTLLDRIAKGAPNARVLLSEITPIREARFDREAVAVNGKLAKFVGPNVTLVPMHDAIGVEDLRDLDHPLPRGNAKIAARFFRYLDPLWPQLAKAP